MYRWLKRKIIILKFCVASFMAFSMIWCSAEAVTTEKTTMEKLVDPLYLFGLVIMISYGVLCWSISRNIKSLDSQICEVKRDIGKIEGDYAELSKEFHELNGSHKTQMAKGGH